MIEGVFRKMARGSRSIGRSLVAFLVLGGALLLAHSYDPARAATTFTVTETGDDADIKLANDRCDSSTTAGDQCTLRAAIEEANDTAGADTIAFDIGGAGASKTITPDSPLPTITDAVTIDGYTQPDASPNTLSKGNDAVINVQLDGLDAGPGAIGLLIEASDCKIKGLVIKRFEDYGIQILGFGSTDNKIEGTFIGISRDGTTDRGNSDGVFVEGGSNTIGGKAPESRNVISGNEGIGIFLGVGADDNKVEGNYIGTRADGSGDRGNLFDGVIVAGGSNTIGGRVAVARNVISNNAYGITVSSSAAIENRIEGNFIGTTADGSGDLGNVEDGVHITGGATFTAVGGTRSGAGNRIAHNGEDGVSVSANNTVGNNILSNSVFDNGGLGIDLRAGVQNADDVTANDTGDTDTGDPNNLQNFPNIILATRSNATTRTTISGRLNSTPTQDFVVQCFLTDGAPGSGHGEGSRLLDTVPISTNANGQASFICESNRSLLGQQPGQTVSTTATNVATGDTSEFSRNRSITIGP